MLLAAVMTLLGLAAATPAAAAPPITTVAAPASDVPTTDVECLEADLVWVLIDNGVDEPTGSCAPEFSNGLEAMESAGVDHYQQGGFVCQIGGFPAVADGEDRCGWETGYWSYWQLNPGDDGTFTDSEWSYSQLGAASQTPLKRSVEGWRYDDFTTNQPTPRYTAPELDPVDPPDEGEVVTIPDDGLRACVASRLGKAATQPITSTEMASITSLDCFYRGIKDLEGAQHLTGATTLTFELNDIVAVTPLADLTALQTLSLDGNDVTDLASLTDLDTLRSLDIDGNPLADPGQLGELTGLQTLYANKVGLTELAPLSGLTGLTTLDVSSNQITSLEGIEGFAQLTTLLAYGNKVTDLGPLSGLTSLTSLNLHSNGFDSVADLAGLTNLTDLMLRTNAVTDISPLASLTDLRSLTIGTNPVTDLRPLTALTQLQELDASRTKVTDLSPLTGMTSLTRLILHGNAITDMTPTGGLGLTSWGALSQEVTLPDAVAGSPYTLPTIRDREGNVLTPTGATPIEDGTVTYDQPGRYTFTYRDAANKFGGRITQTAVEKAPDPEPTAISAARVETRYAQRDTISASVPGATGRVTVTIDGQSRTLWLRDGVATAFVPHELTAKFYTVEWEYLGNATHAPSSTTSRLVVRSAPTRTDATVTKAPTSRATGSVRLQVANPEGTATPRGTVTVTLTQGDRQVVRTRTLVRGQTAPTLPRLAAGSWRMRVDYSGEAGTFLKSSRSTILRVAN